MESLAYNIENSTLLQKSGNEIGPSFEERTLVEIPITNDQNKSLAGGKSLKMWKGSTREV